MRRLLAFGWFGIVIAIILGYSLYLDYAGIVAPGAVYQKHESVSVRNGDWNRSFAVTVKFLPPGERAPWYAQGRINAAAYDHLRIGDAMQARYLPSPILHQIILIPDTRLADQNTFSLPLEYSPAFYRGLAVIAVLAILFILANKAHSRIAGILFLIGGSLAFGYYLFPRQQPAPVGPIETTQATVTNISSVTRLLQGRHSRGMVTQQPYDIVQVSFTPKGYTDAVIGVDEIDSDSIPGLTKGDTIPIQYQLNKPRTIRLLGGDRTFPEKARLTFLITSGAMFLFLLFLHALRQLVVSKAKRFASQARAAATNRSA